MKADGSGLTRLTDSPGYDAEATVGPDGDVIFTSVRDGDIDLYRMKSDGSDVRRLTNLPGYDGGAFFSYDGTQICWRASRPQPEEEVGHVRNLLRRNATPSFGKCWPSSDDRCAAWSINK